MGNFNYGSCTITMGSTHNTISFGSSEYTYTIDNPFTIGGLFTANCDCIIKKKEALNLDFSRC